MNFKCEMMISVNFVFNKTIYNFFFEHKFMLIFKKRNSKPTVTYQ